jgi:Tol biopolymer transport system component
MRMSRRHTLSLALAGAAAAVLAAPALAAKDDLILISRATGPAGALGDQGSSLPSVSASGARVAFQSSATNLSADDGDLFQDIFVRDAATDTTILVSRGTGGAAADSQSEDPAISGDGRFVAFQSDADNLSGDDGPFSDIFVRDLVAGTTTLVSRASGAGGAGANRPAQRPAISADGRFVAFQSDADNLSPDDDDPPTDRQNDIFVRDLVANTTILVSRASGASGAPGDGGSFNPSISGDGNRVAFQSAADNLSSEDVTLDDVFVRDRAAATTTLVSRATGAGGAAGESASADPAIAPGGRFVAFRSSADNLSADDVNGTINVFLRDLAESTTALASRATGPGGAGADDVSRGPVVSDNARVAFSSDADNLSAVDDGFEDVFVRDVLAGTTELVSRAAGPAGAPGNNVSNAPATSADGRYVAFASFATNLVAGTAPGVDNIFRRDVLGDAPVATPACKTLPLPPAPPDKTGVVFTLSVTQLRINQRISQAAIRRLNAVEARLNSGLRARDLCGYSIGPAQLGPGLASGPAAASLAPVAPADPAEIVDPGRRAGRGDPLTLSERQLLINQRIDQAAIRRADGISNRLDAGLTGGDIRAAQVTQGKLYDRLQILSRAPATEPRASATTIPGRRTPPDPDSVTLTAGQLRINQRISQAAVRDANALIRRLETGLAGADLRPATLTAADLG